MSVKVKGVKIQFGGQEIVLPPINLRDMELMQERFAAFTGDASPESIKLIVDATHAALKRNYPEMSREEVAENIDLSNMLDIMECVMDVSGLRRKAQEAAEGTVDQDEKKQSL